MRSDTSISPVHVVVGRKRLITQCVLLCKAGVAGYAFVARMLFRSGEPVKPLLQADGISLMVRRRVEELGMNVICR